MMVVMVAGAGRVMTSAGHSIRHIAIQSAACVATAQRITPLHMTVGRYITVQYTALPKEIYGYVLHIMDQSDCNAFAFETIFSLFPFPVQDQRTLA